MSAALIVQKALRARLQSSSAVNRLVDQQAILDRNQRPVPSPSIVMGEAQVLDDGDSIARNRVRVVHTLHVWKREPSLTGVTEIAGAIRKAVNAGRLSLAMGWHCIDAHVSDSRTLRDPDGEYGHAVVTVVVSVLEETP
jgi:hypothetical protein